MSQTLIKRADTGPYRDEDQPGFRAELPGWDLPTLLQMSCARGDRVCVEVRCGEQQGYLYMAEGRLVHASAGVEVGEPAVAQMLRWPGGNFILCDRPWPLKGTIDASADVVLLRAAQAEDEQDAGRTSEVARLEPTPPRSPRAFALECEPEAEPEPPTWRPPAREGPVIASVRIDMNGEIVAQSGKTDVLAPLVGYVTRMGALLGPQLGLEPFESLAADLGKRRALIFVEGDQMVGLLLPPGALHQELRQQLGF